MRAMGLKVAFGKTIITPPNLSEGFPMAGYYREKKAYGVLDHVFARGVLIEDDFLGNIKKPLLLISLDLTKAPLLILNYIKEKIQSKVDIALGKGQILIACTHTHHAPDITGEYYWPGQLPQVIKGIFFGHNRYDRYIVWMTNEIVKMVKKMKDRLLPAKYAWKKTPIQEPIWLNRRHPTDRTPQDIGVICFKTLDDKRLIGMVIQYGVHPISISFKNDKISADYPGQICTRVEDLTQNQTDVVFFTASCGDINPITTCGTDFEAMEKEKVSLIENDESHPNHFLQLGTFDHAKKIGFFVGENALKIAESIPPNQYYNQWDYKAYTRVIWIPIKDEQHEKRIGVYSWGNWLFNKVVVFLKRFLIPPIAIHAAQEPNFPGLSLKGSFLKGYNCYTFLHYIEINASASSHDSATAAENLKPKKFAILGIPGELFVDLKWKLFKKSPVGAENTFDLHMANDWVGYLFPVKEYITRADYEPFATTTPIAGEYVKREFLNLWQDIDLGLVPFS
jgi:hypothetical protein